VGIAQTARQAVDTLSKIMDLKQRSEHIIQQELGKRLKVGLLLHTHLLKNPLVSIKEVQAVCNISARSAGELVKAFEKESLLVEFTGNFRNRIFAYDQYLNLFGK